MQVNTNKEFYKEALNNVTKFGADKVAIQSNYSWLGPNYYVFYYKDNRIIVSGGGDSPQEALRTAEKNLLNQTMDAEIKNMETQPDIQV